MFRRMNSSNPMLKEETFRAESRAYDGAEAMTINGTINKSLVLWLILAVGAWYSWNAPMPGGLMVFSLIAFVVFMVMIFKKNLSPVLAPVYALLQGLFLGTVSLAFERMYDGIVFNAVMLTMCMLFFMLGMYRMGIIRPTQKLRTIVTTGILSILALYLISFVMSMFGRSVPFLHSSGPIGIGISLFILAIFGLSLIFDFEMIRSGEQYGAPKYMEWYGAVALMLTLIIIYMEMLRLLARLRR
ncbi:MAG: Bax inhibitor-1/YccA family protein [Elusimicrobia bacterium]|nr:Bax inhibitor-1/YccA family protein [Elusimicrobiota bacterium]